MSLGAPITLPCGLTFPNRLCKAAMAETMASDHIPNEGLYRAYSEWADGGWGMILTGNVMVSQRDHGSPGDLEAPRPSASSDLQAAWKRYADACQSKGTPTIVQIVHPGRQSPIALGTKGVLDKAVAPSAVPLNLGTGLVARAVASLVFGTPRPLTTEEIRGPDGVIAQFVTAAQQSFKAGFKGIELHAAHGYLLAQFMSPRTNRRTDDYGGTAAKRARIVTEIVRAVRTATSPAFAVGIKLNSVDVSQSESAEDVIEQIRLIVDAGVDFVEVSGGTYENLRMMKGDAVVAAGKEEQRASPSATAGVKPSTRKREAYFLEFTATLRKHFPDVVLMVTGGFRTRVGMRDALSERACDLVGIARPATVFPRLPREIILNEKEVSDAEASVELTPLTVPWYLNMIPISAVGVGYQSGYYAGKIKEMSREVTVGV